MPRHFRSLRVFIVMGLPILDKVKPPIPGRYGVREVELLVTYLGVRSPVLSCTPKEARCIAEPGLP